MIDLSLRPLAVGDPAPDTDGRTDEGTPISLADFEGRALAVFLAGETLDRRGLILIDGISNRFKEFMRCNCSPIVLSGEPVEILSSHRDSADLPFVLISDPSLALHAALCGKGEEKVSRGVWVIDENSRVCAVIPSMPPREQINAVISALTQLS